MSNKKKKPSTSPLLQSRTFTMELYPEWINFTNILTYIQKFQYAYILHDKDVNEETGEVKKVHAHVVIKYPSRRTLSSVKAEYKVIGVPNNLINTCNERAMLRYLVHADNLEKYQYSKEDVVTNMLEDFEKALFEEITPPQQLLIILEYIDSECSNKIVRNTDVMRYAIRNNCYSALRGNQNMIARTINEHNSSIQDTNARRDTYADTRAKATIDAQLEANKMFALCDTFGTERVEHNGKMYILTRLEDEKKGKK